jgi:uncharacterized protein with HEPN domain
MSRDPLLYVEDIRDACRKVRRFVHGLTKEQFVADEMRFDAVVRNLEVIGEASGRLPADIHAAVARQPWPDIIAMRHVLAHGYFAVDPDIVWSVATTKTDALEQDVCAYLDSHRDQADGHG